MERLLLYIDDLMLYSKSVDEHIEVIKEVLTRLFDYKLKLSGEKCQWLKREVTFLGHVVSDKGIVADPEKTAKVRNWPRPQTVSQLRQFIGFISYFRRFLKGFATMIRALYAMLPKTKTKTSASIEWNPEAEKAFIWAREALVSPPILAHPKWDRPYIVEVDASLQGLGAVLYQIGDDGLYHVIEYASRILRGPELKYPDYSSFKLELLGLKWAITEKFRDYLMGSEVIAYTDNNPLVHLKTAVLGATEQRWVAQLSAFNLKIVYKKGITNVVADARRESSGYRF